MVTRGIYDDHDAQRARESVLIEFVHVALDFRHIPAETYQTILEALAERGYRKNEQESYRFHREVSFPGRHSVSVTVDFLAGEYGGTGRARRNQKVQDARARKARRADLVFEKVAKVVTDFENVADVEARDILRRRCYEEVSEWLDTLGIEPCADS